MTRRKLLALVAITLSALAGAHTLAWHLATRQLEQGFANWVQTVRTQGWLVSTDPPTPGGWPLSATLSLPHTRIQGSQAGLEWTAEAVRLVYEPLHPKSLTVLVEGPQNLRLSEAADIPLTTTRLRATIPLGQGPRLRAGTLDVSGLRAGIPGGDLAIGALTVTGQIEPGAKPGDQAHLLTLDAHDIDVPSVEGRIATLSLDTLITAPASGAPNWRATAAQWQAAGAAIDIRGLTLVWGALDLSGNGLFSLDPALQPAGTANLRIAGHNETLDALVAHHLIAPRAATAAKAVLGLLSRKAAAGGPSEVRVPMALQNRSLQLGRIPLIRLPEILWPDAP
jgi:hypothetical protein